VIYSALSWCRFSKYYSSLNFKWKLELGLSYSCETVVMIMALAYRYSK